MGPAYDAITLAEPRGWGEQMFVYWLQYDDERLSHADLEHLFGRLTKPTGATE